MPLTAWCAVVGIAGSAFPVHAADDTWTIADLQDAIQRKTRRALSCDAFQLQLYAARECRAESPQSQWLERDGELVQTVLKGAIPVELKALLRTPLDPSALVQDAISAAPLTAIHVLVVGPQVDLHAILQSPSAHQFSEPIELSVADDEGPVPSTYRSLRAATVDRFALFVRQSPVVFVSAPPCAGKTAMAALLYDRLVRSSPNTLVARVNANWIASAGSFAAYFAARYGCAWEAFCARKEEERIVLVDEAHYTFQDDPFWAQAIQGAMEGKYPHLHLVLFASHGCLARYRALPLPSDAPLPPVVGLEAAGSKPGLGVTRTEVEEMVRGNVSEAASELIWHLCGGHIGVARALIQYVISRVRARSAASVDVVMIESELRYYNVLNYIGARAIPTTSSVGRAVEAERLAVEERVDFEQYQATLAALKRAGHGRVNEVQQRLATKKKDQVDDALNEMKDTIFDMLNDIASGASISSRDNDSAELQLLLQHGYLYEAPDEHVHFASQMHLKAWLYSTYSERSNDNGVKDVTPTDFLVQCLKRTDAAQLRKIAANHDIDTATRERQLQAEMFRAVTSYVHGDLLVTPEWRASDGSGYVDLMVRDSKLIWCWEILVGSAADPRTRMTRGSTGGRFYRQDPSRSVGQVEATRYVLLDFREDAEWEDLWKPGFIYVSFVDAFARAKIVGLAQDEVSVAIASEMPLDA